jgi:hypothetical protein
MRGESKPITISLDVNGQRVKEWSPILVGGDGFALSIEAPIVYEHDGKPMVVEYRGRFYRLTPVEPS